MHRATAWIWHGDGVLPAVLRVMLAPFSYAMRRVVERRNRRFDRGIGVVVPDVPVLSIGNLTVGGTGKTPLAAWCAQWFLAHGARPAIVMRGYGDDEWRVHQLLSPGAIVVRNPDRSAGIADAVTRGADVIVLDDGFQHRRVARSADLVIVSADAWTGSVRLLPAGPWREPLGSLSRARLVVLSVKAAGDAQQQRALNAIRRAVSDRPVIELLMRSGGLVRVRHDADDTPSHDHSLNGGVDALRGASVVAISAIGDPDAFERQLEALGATVSGVRFADHHRFRASDVARILQTSPHDSYFVCTLKDAVKLGPLWPRVSPRLWYVSQTIEVRSGLEALRGVMSELLAARTSSSVASFPTAD